jgi:hypothetical protein
MRVGIASGMLLGGNDERPSRLRSFSAAARPIPLA